MIEHIPDPVPSDRATLTRKTSAWERESCCAVCGEPVALTTLHMARVIPFDDGDRLAHRACADYRRTQGATLPPLDPTGFGMGA